MKVQRYVVLFYFVGCLVYFFVLFLPEDLKYKVATEQGRVVGLAHWVPGKSNASQSRVFQVGKVSIRSREKSGDDIDGIAEQRT